MQKRIKTALLLLLFVPFACSHQKQDQEQLVLIQIQDRNGLAETISAEERLAKYNNIDFLTEQPYKKVMRLYRKEGTNRSIITTYHPNGTLWQMLETKEMRAFGAFKEWFPSGIQRIDATVIGGMADLTPNAQDSWLFDGKSVVWNEQGQRIAEIPYEKGVLSGTSLFYYPSGSLEKETPYIQDVPEGESTEFWESGAIRAKLSFHQGVQNGLSKSFWPNGNPSLEEVYQQGLLKEGVYWTRSGELVSEVKDGFGFKSIFKETSLYQLVEIRKGLVEGVVKIFDDRLHLVCMYHLKNGKKQGEEIEYFPPQEEGSRLQPKLSLSWDQNAIQGIAKTWYENGELQSQKEFSRNKRSGPACVWYRDGQLMMLEEYEDDVLVKGQYYKRNQQGPVSTISNGTGTATLYDAEGSFLRKIQYVKGKPYEPE
jgi:antitoxin component YwqK of YwqJK toxin-antitoxin module